MDDKYYEVAGFSFTEEKMAKRAKKEADGVSFIKAKIDMEQPEKVLQIYNRTIEEKVFKTPVGISYLYELQQYLKEIPYIEASMILPIPAESLCMGENKTKEKNEKPQKDMGIKQTNIDFKKRYRTTFSVAIVLLVMVIAMFAITLTSNTPTILNYENKLIDRYEHWEQKLNEREQELNERERKLDS